MTVYEVAKLLHVAAAVVWLGSGFFVQVALARTKRAGNAAATRELFAINARASNTVFMPAGILALATGLWMTIDRWDFAQTWISIGLGVFVISSLIGMIYLGPRSERIGDLLQGERLSDEARAAFDRYVSIARVDLVLLFIALWAMVTKPGL